MIMIVGLILWGVSVDKNYHWMVGQAAFFLCNYPILLSAPFPELYITNSHISRSRNPNWKYCGSQLRSRLLSTPIHKRDHLLRCLSQSQRIYQPGN